MYHVSIVNEFNGKHKAVGWYMLIYIRTLGYKIWSKQLKDNHGDSNKNYVWKTIVNYSEWQLDYPLVLPWKNTIASHKIKVLVLKKD